MTREASIYAVGIVAAAAMQFLSVPVYTRYFGPEQYSYLALTLAVTSALSGLILVGGDVALSRFWFEAKDHAARRDLAKTWIGFLTAWSALVEVLVGAFAEPLSEWLTDTPGFERFLIAGLVILVPAQLGRMLAQVLRNEFRPVAFAATSVIVGVLGLLIGIGLAVPLGMGMVGALWGTACAELLGCVIRLPLVRRELRGSFRLDALWAPLRFGAPFVPATVAYWVFTGADRIVVSRYLGPTDLGMYAVAATLVAPFSLVVIALGQAWVPRIMQQYEVSRSDAAEATGRAIELSLLLFGLAAVVVAALAPWLVEFMSGPAYRPGAVALPLLALGSALFGTSLFTSTGFTLAKRSGLFPIAALLVAALNVVLLLTLVPRFGLVGAASAVAISYTALSVGLLALSKAYVAIPLRPGRIGLVALILAGDCVVATAYPATATLAAVTTASLVALGLVARLAIGPRSPGGSTRRT